MFSACQALKMHLSDDIILSSSDLVCSVYCFQCETLKVTEYACVFIVCTFNGMSLDGCGEKPGCVEAYHLKRDDVGVGHKKHKKM